MDVFFYLTGKILKPRKTKLLRSDSIRELSPFGPITTNVEAEIFHNISTCYTPPNLDSSRKPLIRQSPSSNLAAAAAVIRKAVRAVGHRLRVTPPISQIAVM